MDFTVVLRSITIERLSRTRALICVEEVSLPLPFAFAFGLGFGGLSRLGVRAVEAFHNTSLRNRYHSDYAGYAQHAHQIGEEVPKIPSSYIRADHLKQFQQSPQFESDFYLSDVVLESHVSSTPFAQLKPTSISNLKLNIPSKGCYLLLRSVENALNIDDLVTVVEDCQARVIHLTVRNFTSNKINFPTQNAFPLGTKFILKEPVCIFYNGKYTLFSETPSNLIILPRHHPQFKLVENVQWGNEIAPVQQNFPNPSGGMKGKQLYTKGKYFEALEVYHLGIRMTCDDNACQLLNVGLSETYYALGYYEKALVFSSHVFKLDSKHKEALLLSGRAECELRNYENALEHFTLASESDPLDTDVDLNIKFCNDRIEESNGDIQIYKLYRFSESKPQTPIAQADYEGPVEVVTIPGKGRGVVATENVKPGTLLVVSKAFACVLHSETQYTHHFGIDPSRCKLDPKLVREVAQLVYKNPNTLLRKLYDLTSSGNTRACFCDEESKDEPIIDLDLIRNIVKDNQFVIEPYTKEFGFIEGEVRGSGLFPFASFINHSCVPNANHTTFNDVLVVRSVREIKRGEEVTIAYVQPTVSFSEKSAYFARLGFACDCPMCQLDRLESPDNVKKREDATLEIEKNFPKYFGTESFKDKNYEYRAVTELRYSIKKIQKTYRVANRNDYKIALALPYICSFQFQSRKSSSKCLLDYLWNALRSFGFDHKELVKCGTGESELVIPPNALLIPFTLFPIQLAVRYYQKMGEETEKEKWFKVLSILENILTGANEAMVRSKFKLK